MRQIRRPKRPERPKTDVGSAPAQGRRRNPEFQRLHEISRLTGSPPGYLGHRETPPLLTQENLSRFQTPNAKLTFALFDEIEKASDSLWRLLLGVLDKARLTLGDNRRVNFSNCYDACKSPIFFSQL